MVTRKGDPAKVNPGRASRALSIAGGNQHRQTAWTQYTLLSYRETGSLAPGCEMRDLQAWYEARFGPRTVKAPHKEAN